jgi:hypothetical protein
VLKPDAIAETWTMGATWTGHLCQWLAICRLLVGLSGFLEADTGLGWAFAPNKCFLDPSRHFRVAGED